MLRTEIPPLQDFIGKTEQKNITIVYIPTASHILQRHTDSVTNNLMTINKVSKLPNQAYQVNIKGQRTQFDKYQDALKFLKKNKPKRRTIAQADLERDQAYHILDTLQKEIVQKDKELLQLAQLDKQNRLLHLLNRPQWNDETVYYGLLNSMRVNNLLTLNLQPITEAHALLLAEIKELLNILPTHKEFKELLRKGKL